MKHTQTLTGSPACPHLHYEVPMSSFHKTNLVQTQTDTFKSSSGFVPVLLSCTVDLSSAGTLGADANHHQIDRQLKSTNSDFFFFFTKIW